ncbi:Crp/Fnr family transcriptional regulator [Rhodohalobacter mucosus]|uniref:Crp/Fnr family transcriptional regulator n=2 Tax=Rhodohalobacter mucosus TaxID=2079485 RepID=A0A316TW86_9BACT|nr:Crp/Fnr family transcriptional regulator [Rhodohalobacter mucosus]
MSALVSEQLPLTEEEAAAIDECIPIRRFSKGTLLLREGQIATDSYFNLQGCVRHYYLIDGEEKTTAFYTEGESIASLSSYINKTPANHYLECVEECTLAVLNYDKEQELYGRVEGFESLCRASVEEDLGKQQQLLAQYITKSPEDRYLDLLKNRPDLMQRVPQYHLASYIGVKPESLSRIRKRIAERK